MSEIKRWYDKSPKLKQLLYVLSNMTDKEVDQVAIYLNQVVHIFWKEKKSNSDEVLSIGVEKLFGYYKAYQKRRWYDRNPSLSSAVNLMSTLPAEDLDDIVDGFLYALREAGLYKFYTNKKQQIVQKEND